MKRRSNLINEIATPAKRRRARDDKRSVCIIGVGLIGGSLGMALRRVQKNGKKVYTVFGLGRSLSSLMAAHRRGAVDDFETRPGSLLRSADIVVLAVPVHAIPGVVRKFRPYFKKGALLTDVGSVKAPLLKAVRRALGGRTDLRLVGAHPIAGSEKTGVENADKNLFKGATCVVTTDRAQPRDRNMVGELWRSTGASVVFMPAQNHDEILALTSHLPHLVAFSMFALVQSAVQKYPLIKKLAAGSFRDITRIAASDGKIWSGIFDSNRGPLCRQSRSFLKMFHKLARSNRSSLLKRIDHLSRNRRKW